MPVTHSYDCLSEVLFTADVIRARVEALGQSIDDAYPEGEELVAIVLMNGALFFAADLLRELRRPVCYEGLRVSSYGDKTAPEAQPQLLDRLKTPLSGRHVLIVDDILDTGNTMERLFAQLEPARPASLGCAVLLQKEGRRQTQREPEFCGFTIPNAFVVGYGLDFAQRYRALDCIGILREDLQSG